MFKYVLLSNSTGCPDNYARIVNVSSDVHRYGTIVFDNLNDRYELDLHITLVKRKDHDCWNSSRIACLLSHIICVVDDRDGED